MILIERHIIAKASKEFKPLDELCKLSKNLYNSALYAVRQYYFETKTYKNKFELINEFTRNSQPDYIALPRKVSQKVLYQVDNSFKSFFSSLKSENVNHKVSIPKYLDKDGRNVVTFTNQAISSKRLKDGWLQLSGVKDFELKVQHTNIKEVKIVHKGHSIEVLIAYEQSEKPLKEKRNRISSVDLGLNNLATIGSNCIYPFIINGKPLKSINHFYNKKLSQLKSSQKEKSFNSRKIEILTLKRNNKVNDYLHKSSRLLVNHLVSNNIDTIIIGHNMSWKQETNMGRRNNLNFVQIPHSKFIEMLRYKCQLEGINFIVQEESYTSKCSFLDEDYIPTFGKDDQNFNPSGQRIKRGLYKSRAGQLINADLNGALNILRKAVPNALSEGYGIQVCSMPSVFTVKL